MDMIGQIVPMVVASFVSGVTGALTGGAIVVVSLKTDMRWVKSQIQALHHRASKLDQKVDDTREQLFKNLP